MRWALSFLLLAAAAATAAEETRFSHKLHMGEVGLPCAACHSSVTTSAAETDDNLPASATCLACHNGGEAPEIDASWLDTHEAADRNFRFSHEFHLGMGNIAPILAAAIESGDYLGHPPDYGDALETANACSACHRGLNQADLVDSKVHLPAMTDCLVCHNKIDNPFSCEECHAADFQLKPADHTRSFVDQHSTGKMGFDKLTCQPCHGKKFTCMGCH